MVTRALVYSPDLTPRGPGTLGMLLKLSVLSYGLNRVLLPSNSYVAAQAPPVGGLWR